MSIDRRGLKLLVLAAAFILPAGLSRRVAADQDESALAERARAVLSQRCFQCHGMNGVARKNINVSDYDRLISSRVLIPGDGGSLLLKVIESGEMPLGGPELSQADRTTVRDWVLRGAKNWTRSAGGATTRQVISEHDVLRLIQQDLLDAGERSRPYFRYLSLAHLYDAGVSDEELSQHRSAISKLINSLSWHREIAAPAAIDRAQTVFRIDLRDYNWTPRTGTPCSFPILTESERRKVRASSGSPVRG